MKRMTLLGMLAHGWMCSDGSVSPYRQSPASTRSLRRHTLRTMKAVTLLTMLACGGLLCAQESPPPPPQSPPSTPALQVATTKNGTACLKPAPLVRLQDYDGPLRKTVGIFARKLELTTVHAPNYQPGAVLCSLDLKDKFFLFVRDTYDPVTVMAAGLNAGFDQAENNDPSFGQGGSGYGKRFAANFADEASSKFFKEFAYPAIFSEDPRYYRLDHGTGRSRLLHAIEHTLVAHRNTGEPMFNVSEWLGTTSAVVLSNTYHPGNRRGFGPSAEMVSYRIGEDMGFDVLREFWPEIARKFRLPFRDEHDRAASP
jgi:hypothetical protein